MIKLRTDLSAAAPVFRKNETKLSNGSWFQVVVQKVKSCWQAILTFLQRFFSCKRAASPKQDIRLTQPQITKQDRPISQELDKNTKSPKMHSLDFLTKPKELKKSSLPARSPNTKSFGEKIDVEKNSPDNPNVVQNLKKQNPVPSPNQKTSNENSTFFDKIPDRVLSNCILEFLDCESVDNLTKASSSLYKKIPPLQKTLYLPRQMALLKEENMGKFNNIHSLNLSFEKIDNNILSFLAEMVKKGLLPNVKTIHIAISEDKPFEIEEGFVRLIKELPGLEHFTTPVKYGVPANSISLETLHALASHCPLLKTIRVSCLYNPHAHDVIYFSAKTWPQLETLNINCTDHKYINSIVKNCPQLRKIDLSYNKTHNRDIELIAACCPHLESLRLNGTCEILPSGFEALGKGCPELQEFAYSNRFYILTHLHDILPIAQRCSKLRVLELPSSKMTEAGIEALNACCLQRLNLNLSRNITSAQLSTIFTNQPQLEELILDRTYTLLEPVILSKPHQLKILSLNAVECLSDENFIPLISKLPNLEILNIRGSEGKLTDNFLDALAKHCPNLKHLYVNEFRLALESKVSPEDENKSRWAPTSRFVEYFSRDARKRLQASNPQLKIEIGY